MTKNLVFIDSRVINYQALISTFDADTQWVLLDAAQDGVLQMQAALMGYSGLDSIQIFSHGSPGTLYLGSTTLTNENLASYSGSFASIGASLTESGDILLYGCSVGAGDTGQAFIESLAMATGADVAASVDATGAEVLGGDWVLEQVTGRVEGTVLATPSYSGLLSRIVGGEGNDVLAGAGSADGLIAGLGGQDVVTYSGVYANYTITGNPLGGPVQVAGPFGTDTLFSIESLRFSDATIQLNYVGEGSVLVREGGSVNGDLSPPLSQG